MKVIILCGGSGTRLREQTEFIPKPLIPIGPFPMVVHIMKLYAHYGFREFVLALGYKQEKFKEYFLHYDQINNDITLNLGSFRGEPYHGHYQDNWRVTLVDTGESTMKGARLKRVERYVGNTFFLTYGDSIGDVDIKSLLSFHQSHGKLVTVTGVHPQARFGELHVEGDVCRSFTEKPENGDCWVNGGFMVMNRGVFDYLSPDEWCDLEVGALELIASKGEMRVWKHGGYWGCCDTLKELDDLNRLWREGKARWRI